jgi:hypothetical protein
MEYTKRPVFAQGELKFPWTVCHSLKFGVSSPVGQETEYKAGPTN